MEKFNIFGFWTTVDSLAKGDVLKWDDIFESSLTLILMKLRIDATQSSYNKKRMDIETRERDMSRKKR